MRIPRLAPAATASLALALAVSAAAAPATPGPNPADVYQATEVADGVVVAVHGHGSNLTCLRHGDGLVFVDAGLSTAVAARFRADMERRFSLKARALVLTHAHLDHVLGMGAFADVPVVAAAAGRAFLEELASYNWPEAEIAATARVFPTFPEDIREAKPFLPTIWFDSEVQLGTPDDPIAVRRTGGHSACSSHVWWPRTKVIVAGDLLQARRRPYFGDPATDLGVWIATLQRWLDDGAARFCPGHGPAIGADEVAAIRTYFVELTKAMAALKARGVPLEAVADDPSLPPGYWPADASVPRWWPLCLAAAYRGV